MTTKISSKQNYHHGDLAASLIDAAVFLIKSKGAVALSMREVARTAGVSHAAPAHHFGDKTGLLTAIAINGYKLLATALEESQLHKTTDQSRLIASGEAYIKFSVKQNAYFSVMFQIDLINGEDKELFAVKSATQKILRDNIKNLTTNRSLSVSELDAMALKLWSQVHGFSTLWHSGNLGDPENMDLLETRLSSLLSSLTLELD